MDLSLKVKGAGNVKVFIYILSSDEMMTVITDCDHFAGDKVGVIASVFIQPQSPDLIPN